MDINKAIGGAFMLIAVYLIFAGRDTRGQLTKLVGSGGNVAVDLIGTLQGRSGSSGVSGARTVSYDPAFEPSGRMGVNPLLLA